MLLITCKTGGEHIWIDSGDADRDPHSRLDAAGCSHCKLGLNADPSHHCGRAAANADECEAANHPGEACWHPPDQPERPENCTVCRPVLIELPRGTVQVTGAY